MILLNTLSPSRTIGAVRILLASTLLAAASVATAGTASLEWTPPTTRVDGSDLTDLAGYSVHWGCQQTGDYPDMVTVMNPGISGYIVDFLPDIGTCYFAVRAINSAGLTSDFSNEAFKVMGAGDPNPPTPPTNLVVVDPNRFAYGIQVSRDMISLVAVGTVPPGTTCDPTRDVNGFNLVSRDVVQFPSPTSPRPEAVFALCGTP